jgi:hypothetical protein
MSELVDLITLVVTASIVFILLMSLAAGGLALALIVVFLIRSLHEGSAPGIQFGEWMLRLITTGRMRNIEVEDKTLAICLRDERSELKALSVTNQPK